MASCVWAVHVFPVPEDSCVCGLFGSRAELDRENALSDRLARGA